jgi:hypothetical protein
LLQSLETFYYFSLSTKENMQITSVIVLAAFTFPSVYGHGVITEVQGANGVVMPGLTGKNFSTHAQLRPSNNSK